MSNRIIKFRGKRVDNGEWVYGYYFVHLSSTDRCPDMHCIYDGKHIKVMEYHEVHPDTVGQYTGKKFEDKTEVYLGDFAQEYKDGPIREIIWDDIFSGFRMRNWLDMEETVPDYANVFMCKHCKKVGTIHDKESP